MKFHNLPSLCEVDNNKYCQKNEMKNDEAVENSNEQEKNDKEKLKQEKETANLNEESPKKDVEKESCWRQA